jgi:hypothetical protein
VLPASATAVTATDINPETLDVARTRRYGPAPVTFQVADAYALEEVPGRFDMAFIGFFWSHILRGDLPRFPRWPARSPRPGCRGTGGPPGIPPMRSGQAAFHDPGPKRAYMMRFGPGSWLSTETSPIMETGCPQDDLRGLTGGTEAGGRAALKAEKG